MKSILLRFPFVRELEEARETACNLNRDLKAELQSERDRSITAELRIQELEHELSLERTKRISAEVLAEHSQRQVSALADRLDRAEKSRDEAVLARMSSLDLVNTSLLKAMAPTAPPQPPAGGMPAPVPKQKVQGAWLRQQEDRKFMLGVLNLENKRREQRMAGKVDAEQPAPAPTQEAAVG